QVVGIGIAAAARHRLLEKQHRAVVVPDRESLARPICRIRGEIDQLPQRPVGHRRHAAPRVGTNPGRGSGSARGSIRSDPRSERKYSTVRATPTRTSTFGSHPSSDRAREMSGCRTFGSSTGSGLYWIADFVPVAATTI